MYARTRPTLLVLALLVFASQVGLGGCRTRPFTLSVTTPTHGSFSTAASVVVEGWVTHANLANVRLFVNGTEVFPGGNGFYSTSVSLDPAKVFNPVFVQARDTSNNQLRTQRVVVIAGESVADGDFSLDSIALRLNDSGLDSVEPLVSDLVDIDLSTLLPVGTVVVDECFIDSFLGCTGRARVSIVNPPPSFGSLGLDVDSMFNFVAGDVVINDIQVFTFIDGSGLVPNCNLTITADAVSIFGDYSLSPDAADPSLIDVNLLGSPAVSFTNFDSEFTSGLCDFPVLGAIIQAIIGDIQPTVVNGLVAFLSDPDGSGPLDAPLADGIETALADIQIAGPIGEGLGVSLEAPLFTVIEDSAGITLGSDGRITASFGTGPGQCDPPPGAPDLAASLHVPEPFPTFGATTPGAGLPYGLGICISSSAFNQLLKAQIECGLLQVDLTEIDLFGTGTPEPVTVGTLTPLIPELAAGGDPSMPLVIEIRPTLAPVLTGNPGPQGELAELRVGGLRVAVVEPGLGQTFVAGQVDFGAGLQFSFDDLTGELVPTITSVSAGDIDVGITENLIGTNPGTLTFLLEALLPSVLPSIGDTLGSFPLPDFLGLQLQSVAVEQNGEFVSLFADLVPQ